MMPSLTYYVPATGRYGVKAPGDLANAQTFGSQGASVCVILLLVKSDGNLFCGHMACGLSGMPANEDLVKERVNTLLNDALGAGNKGQAWKMTSSAKDPTTIWMKTAMTNWFTLAPTEDSSANMDGYFSKNNGVVTLSLSNGMDETGAIMVDTGDFLVQ
ncbi:hypothetical protein [Yersinia ruckeri]|uniref:hypothetical protein n=1 Tax=Yersinia ruckeri TaxID=29486 RepID=UPI001114D660|nr:hypothetical protein [Yersinia ruckeri]EKN4686870.1 hypothetical protein [Yersinia ruckeri]MCK8583337.1 hypothetical protein [Yersinia ruckeri]